MVIFRLLFGALKLIELSGNLVHDLSLTPKKMDSRNQKKSQKVVHKPHENTNFYAKNKKSTFKEINLMAKIKFQSNNGRCHFEEETKPDLLDPSKLLKDH